MAKAKKNSGSDADDGQTCSTDPVSGAPVSGAPDFGGDGSGTVTVDQATTGKPETVPLAEAMAPPARGAKSKSKPAKAKAAARSARRQR